MSRKVLAVLVVLTACEEVAPVRDSEGVLAPVFAMPTTASPAPFDAIAPRPLRHDGMLLTWRLVTGNTFNELRIGRTEDKLTAVSAYLLACRGVTEVDPIWADEVVLRDAASGEWVFEGADVCPGWPEA